MSEEVKLPQKKTRPKSFTLEEFADAIAKADPEAKKEFAKSLGLVQAVKKTPVANKPTNEDVKRMMLAFGDASHDENFALHRRNGWQTGTKRHRALPKRGWIRGAKARPLRSTTEFRKVMLKRWLPQLTAMQTVSWYKP